MKLIEEQATTLSDDAQKIGDADRMLGDAIFAADECASDDEQAILAVMEQLKAAMDYVTQSTEAMNELTHKHTIYADYLISAVESEETTFPALLEEIGTCIDNGFESKEQIEQYIVAIEAGYTAYVQNSVLETSDEEHMGDITAAVLNANFEGLYGGAAKEYWDITRDGGTEAANFNAYELFNNNSFLVSKTVTGLADGYYRVRVQGFYRPGTNDVNVEALASDPDYGQNVKFFAGETRWIPLCNVMSAASTTSTGANGEREITLSEDNKVYVPNSMESAAAYFDLEQYWNQLDVKVEGGSLTFGLRKNVHVSEDWTIWNKFELYYLGTNAPTSVETIPVDTQATTGFASTMIYSIGGSRLSHLTKGVNIVKKTLADGTVKIQKVLVR